jgi:hypothetical protein
VERGLLRLHRSPDSQTRGYDDGCGDACGKSGNERPESASV